MASSSIKLFALIVVFLTVFHLNQASSNSPKTHVYVYNDVGGGVTLSVHCWSKDDDLNIQDIPPNGFWTFSFGLDVFGQTRFDCTYRWPRMFHHFPIYIQKRDSWSCQNCIWMIGYSGPCLRLDSGERCYNWQDSAKGSMQLPVS